MMAVSSGTYDDLVHWIQVPIHAFTNNFFSFRNDMTAPRSNFFSIVFYE